MLLLIPAPLFATAYTVTSTPRVMHVGDVVPPCDTLVKTGSTVSNAGSTIWSAPPTCTIPTGSLGTPGTYTITVTPGTLVSGGDSATYTNGSIMVIAPDGIGAGLVNAFIPNNGATSPPSGFFSSSLQWSVLNATSNPVCNMSTGASDNTDCFQHLIAAARGAQTATVKCSGTTVTASAGTPFTGILTSDGEVNINGVWFTVASYTDATHLVLTTTPASNVCSTASVTLYLPRTIVSVTSGSTAVTWVSGPQFTNLTVANENLQIGTAISVAKIASVTDATHLVLQTAFQLPTVTGNVPMYLNVLVSGGGAGAMPLYLYFPCGQYKIAHPITSYGAYSSMWGQGQCSELYVPPNSPDFQTVTNPLFAVNPVGANQTFHWFIRNMWFHIGVGNPKAIGLTYAPSNDGALRNLLISSDDAAGVEGLNLGKSFTGPGMIRNIAVYGFAIGISSNIPNHSMTMEDITVEGQTTSGIANVQTHEQVRNALFSEPGVPFATNSSATASLVVMSSEGWDNSGALCFQNSTTALQTSVVYLRGLAVNGSCTTTLSDWGSGTLVQKTGDITEYWTGTPSHPFPQGQSLFDSGTTAASLNLTIQETPQANDPAVSGWTQLSSTDPTTWQTALNACTSTTYFIAPGIVTVVTPATINITIPDCVNHLQTFDVMTPTPGGTYHIIFTVAGTSTTPLILENCPNAQCGFSHTGSRTVVMLDINTYNYATSPGAGNLFCDDCILGGTLNSNGGVTFQASQNVWMRQSNQEQVTQPKLTFLGGTAWIFGQKTEHNGPNLTLQSGSQVELLGGEALGDPSVQGAGGNVVISTDSNFSMAGFTASTQCTITGTPPCNNQFTNWIQETRTGTTLSLPIPNATTVGGTQNMGLYYALGATAPPAPVSVQVQGAKIQGMRIQ